MNFNSNQNIGINDNYNNKKSKKTIIILFLFLIILLGTVCFVYSYYTKNYQKEVLREEVFGYIKNNDLNFFIKNEIYTDIAKKVEKEDYESSTDIKLSTTMENNMFSKLDLAKFEFNYAFSKDNNDKKSFGKILTKYAGNDLLTLDFIQNDNKIAIKSDEIVNKYVGVDKSNIQTMADKLVGTETDLSSAKKIKNFLIDRELIDVEKILGSKSISKYATLIKDNTSADKFSKKENVVVTIEGEQINTAEYKIEITNDQFKNILTGISEMIENDDEILSELTVSSVQDFENDDEILEYTDNENVVEISGQENNFNTYMNWENVNQNQQSTNSTNTANTVLNQVQTNTAVENNTITNNVVTNETENQNTTILNQTEVETILPNEPGEIEQQEPTGTIEQPSQNQQEETNSEIQSNEQQTQNAMNENVIEEEDNFRTQGFIEINDPENSLNQDSAEMPFIVGENFEDTTKNIIKATEKINLYSYLLTGAKANYSREEILEQIQKNISEKIEENNSLIVKLYVADGKTIKISFEIVETTESFDVEILSKGENEKYLNIISLVGTDEQSSGYKIGLYKKIADADLKNKITINKINKNKINKKTIIDLETKGTKNSKKYVTNANVLYSDNDGEFKIEIVNSLKYNEISDVEELNIDNCLFIDEIQNDEELLMTRDAIKQKTIEVLRQKNKNLNIIEINNENSIVQQNEQNNVIENSQGKEEAKQILIQTISNKMGEYLNNGTQLKIEDLEGLEIPGYEVNISISSNLAIITVNGHKFKLDSEFNLSDS